MPHKQPRFFATLRMTEISAVLRSNSGSENLGGRLRSSADDLPRLAKVVRTGLPRRLVVRTGTPHGRCGPAGR